jgi:hypothetical protein
VALIVVTAFVLFFAIVFGLVAFLGWKGLSGGDRE